MILFYAKNKSTPHCSKAKQMKVAVIGAGISGLVAGILLQEQGCSVHIYEKRSRLISLGGGLGIWPNGSRGLLSLPCADKISLLAEKIEHDTHADSNGEVLTTVSRQLFQRINGFPILNMSRSELMQVLLEQFGEENITYNAQCIGIESHRQSTSVSFANGEYISADLLIGADGAFSSVRQCLFSEAKLNYSGYLQLVGIVRNANPECFQPHFIWGHHHLALTFPIAQKRHIMYHVLPYPEKLIRSEQLSCRQQIDLFRGWSREVDARLNLLTASLAEADGKHYYCGEAHYLSSLPSWHHYRCVLLGDAAHKMGSILGLGATLGIEGAHALAHQLSDGVNIDAAIANYELQHRPRVDAFLRLEQEATQFLLTADEAKYHQYLSDLKTKSPEIMNQAFIQCLMPTDSNKNR